MKTAGGTEISHEIKEAPTAERRIESLDDIVREIADRRLVAEFRDTIPPECAEVVRAHPDCIESQDEFERRAENAGIRDTNGVLGWSTNLESPAHILRSDVSTEIATLIHEDTHRMTHKETLREMTVTPQHQALYEGITEHFTQQATNGLYENESEGCYTAEVAAAKELVNETGEQKIRDYYFKHEMVTEVQAAIERLLKPTS
jgi:hypothetical protein